MSVLPDEGTTYTYQSLTVGDPTNCVGICTLWTPQEKIARRLDRSEYGRIGNLYSRDGINHIVRNVLADPVVRYIIICGVDLTGGGEAFLRLAANGIDGDHRIIGDVGLMDASLPREAIELFRENVQLIDRRGTTDPDVLRAVLADLLHLPPFGPPRIYPSVPAVAETYPAEGHGISVRGRKVASVWLQALAAVLRFGEETNGPFGDRVKDLPDLVAVVTGEDADAPDLPDWLPVTADYLDAIAYPLLLSADPPEGLADTEGERLFAYDGIDQVARLADQLRAEPATHRATAVLWNPLTDGDRVTAPNLIGIQARRHAGRLVLTATLRSVEIYRGWPETAFGLRTLQQRISDAAGLDVGPLTMLLHSAHISADAWDLARDVVEQNRRRVVRRPRKEDRDPRGSFVIHLADGAIQVTHYSPQGVRLQQFSGTTAAALALEILPFISQIDHALHLGGELQKAEIALRAGAPYMQDAPLPLPGTSPSL